MNCKEEEEDYEAECNVCDWKGNKDEMLTSDDDGDEISVCPNCGSTDIYYFK